MAIATKLRLDSEKSAGSIVGNIARFGMTALLCTGCISLDVTQPNQDSTETHAKSSNDETTQTKPENSQAGPACAHTASKASFGTWIEQRCQQMFSCCGDEERTSLLGAAGNDVAGCKKGLTQALLSKHSSPQTAKILDDLDSELAAALYLISTEATEVRAGCLSACMTAQLAKGCETGHANHRCTAPDNYPGGPCDPHLIFEGTLGENDPCDPALVDAGLDVQCRYGLDCKPRSDGTHRCTPVAALGEACLLSRTRQGSCEHDAVCHPGSKTCVKGALVGEACDHGDASSFVGCSPGLECGLDRRCIPACQAGAHCVNAQKQSDDRLCPENFSCYPGDFPHCRAKGGNTSACDSDGDCSPAQYCSGAQMESPEGAPIAGECRARIGSGSCTRNRMCNANSFCNTQGQCTPKLAEDKPCTSSSQCSAAAPLCASVDRDAKGATQTLRSVCLSGPRASSTCVVKDSALQDAELYQSYLRPEVLRVQPADAPWVSVCKDGGCERSSGAPARCVAFASLDQACDHLPGEGAATCAPGLHCVSGTCKNFAATGALCDPESESWNAWDPDHRQGFPSALCNPEHSRCIETELGSHCHIDEARSGQALCAGDANP